MSQYVEIFANIWDVWVFRKDALSGQRECDQKTDAALQKLGQGIESTDCSLWRTTDPVSVNRKAGKIFYSL